MNKQRCGGLILSLMGICLSVEMGSVIAQDSNQKSTNASTSISKCNSNIQPVGIEFNREIERQPNFAKAYNDRGEANLRLGNCNKAIEDFDRAIELLADYSKALVNRGNSKSLLGKYDEAISDFDRVADNGDAIAGKAVATILLKKRELRESSLASKKKSTSAEDRQEVSENQTQSFSCYGYEELKIEQKDVNTNQAILANPDRPYAYYFRYEVRKKYDLEGAKQDLQRAKELILTHKDSLDLEGIDISDEFRAQFSSTPYISSLRKIRVELTRSEALVGGNKRVKPSSRRKP